MDIRGFFVALAITFAFIPSHAKSIHECLRQEVVAAAYVELPFFAEEIRDLRFFCKALNDVKEAADIVWSQYDKAYECRVGSFCTGGGI